MLKSTRDEKEKRKRKYAVIRKNLLAECIYIVRRKDIITLFTIHHLICKHKSFQIHLTNGKIANKHRKSRRKLHNPLIIIIIMWRIFFRKKKNRDQFVVKKN